MQTAAQHPLRCQTTAQPIAQPLAQPVAQPQRRAALRRGLLAGSAALLAVTGLAGCAAMRSISFDVSSYGEWPAGRSPGSYAFERLPSQQARAAETALLEDSARAALAKAGFAPVAEGQAPDVLVQVGARVGRADGPLWDDPLWWRGGFGSFRYGPWVGPRWALTFRHDFGRYEHQAAVLLRDRASGKPVFEARAVHESSTELTSKTTLGLMFEAALMDFPKLGMNPRTVVLQLP
jgi:hypothetical protein